MNLILLLGAGVVVAAMTGGAYFKGHSSGVAKDRDRSDAVLLRLQNDAAAKLAAANRANADTSATLQSTKEKAEHALQTERSRATRRIADATATAGLVRDQLAAVASGTGADQTSVTACRRDASALGDVLSDAVRVLGVCVEAAEHEAGNARVLLNAWPTLNPKGEVK